jgi:cell division protein FtsA
MQRKVLCEIIESRMREIAGMVKVILDRSEQTSLVGSAVVLTGGGAMLAGAEQVFEDVLRHSRVRSAEPVIPEMAFSAHSFATAVGLARFAIECAEDELVPAGGSTAWKDRIRTIWSLIKR